MRADEVEFLLVPGWTDSGPDHWQSRWAPRLKGARRAQMPDFNRPVKDDWVRALRADVAAAQKPVLIVAHSCGALAVVHAAAHLTGPAVAGAMLVAPTDLSADDAIAGFLAEAGEGVERPSGFDPLPQEKFPFPALVVASRNDPFCTFEKAENWARAWGAAFGDAGEAGHINSGSGFGPWPEGAIRLAAFLKSL